MKEATHVWQPLRDNFKKLEPAIHLQRIENSVGNGVPDTNGCLRGRDFWIELKVAKGNRVELTPLQASWLARRAAAGGRTWVLARKGGEFRLWRGADAQLVLQEGWHHPPALALPKPWDWSMLLRLVVGLSSDVRPRRAARDPNAPLPGQLPMFAA